MRTIVEPQTARWPEPTASNGCFETMRAYGGRIFRLDAHLERLWASAASLGVRPSATRSRLGKRLLQALRRSGLDAAMVRVALRPGTAPSIVVKPLERPPDAAYRCGVRVAVVPTRRFEVAAIDAQAKYSARLGSILAVQDAQLRGADEALFTDSQGYITESTASNFGIVFRGAIWLPPCWLGLLVGITRDVMLELATRIRVPVRESPFTRHELYNAEEAFLSSTTKEVLPVTMVDGRTIGAGVPGPVTDQLRRAFTALVRRELQLRRPARAKAVAA